MLGNNTLPEIIKDDVQCLDQSNIQHFKMSNSSALKSTIGKGAVSVCLHVINQINLDNGKYFGDEFHVDTVCVMWVDTYFYDE